MSSRENSTGSVFKWLQTQTFLKLLERERERERESYKNYSMKQPQWMMVSEVDSGISGVQFAGNN